MTLRYSMAMLAGALGLVLTATPLSIAAPAAAGAASSRAPADGAERLASTGPAGGEHDETPEIPAIEQGDSIAAIVNDTPITSLAVDQRMRLFMATSGVRPNAKQKKEIREQVLKQLETERIQLLEAQAHDITVSSGEVDKAIENIIQDNNLDKKKLEEMLSGAGVYMETLRAQIAAQIAWSKTVQARYGSEADVTPAQVDAEMRRMKENADKPRYRVSEIFEAVDSPEEADKVLHDMQELEGQLRAGAPFAAVARQFSQNPTAAQGGDLGYVSPGQLPPELDKALVKMQAGQVSPPIRSAGGYYILGVHAVEVPEGTKLPDQEKKPDYPPNTLPLSRVLLPIGPNPPKELLKNATQAAAVLREHIESCKVLPEIVSKMKGAVYMNLGLMNLDNLSQQIRDEVNKTPPGGVTEPFQSPAGVELIVRCDPAPPKVTTFKMPTRDQIENQLYQEQLAVLARRYMRDLRRDADIETR